MICKWVENVCTSVNERCLSNTMEIEKFHVLYILSTIADAYDAYPAYVTSS